jgi:integrase
MAKKNESLRGLHDLHVLLVVCELGRPAKESEDEPRDFYNNLHAWEGITAGLIETFIQWQKMQGYAIGLPGLSPHDCRHSWATRAACTWNAARTIKASWRWRNLETPLSYIKASESSNEGMILE